LIREAPVLFQALSPDGRLIAATTDARELVAWDTASGRELWKFHAPDVPTIPSFSPDGRMVATGAFDGKVYVFESRSGRAVGKPFIGQNGFVWVVSFQKGTRLVASTGTQGDTHLTDPITGKSFGATLTGKEGWASGAWNPSGTEFATFASDGHAYLWDMSPRSWEERACAIADRPLTREEWTEFLPDRPYHPAC
jgi:WD40 repeat protein